MVKRAASLALLIAAAMSAQPLARTADGAATMAVVARDTRGRVIQNLQPGDVEVREAGEARAVSAVVYRSGARRLALFLDEYHVAPGANSDRARTIAQALIRRSVRPGDALFLMQPLDSQRAIAPVTSLDHAQARVAAFAGRKDDLSARDAFEAEYLSTAPAAVVRERAQIVRSALLALVVAMRDEPEAPKALIVITEGFTDARSRRRLATLPIIARAARQANVPVYVVDPSVALGPDGALGEGWGVLQAQTGGTQFGAGQDPEAIARRIVADLESQFLVSFEAAAVQDGAFRAVDVRGRRAGLSIRAPSGYWAPFAASALAPVSARISYSELLTPHVSGLIEPWFRMAPAAEGRTRVTFAWKPSSQTTRVPASVEFAAITFEGTRLHEATVLTRSAAEGAAETSFEAPPGPLQISMAVSDGTRLLDTDVRYLEVPKLDTDRPVITAVEFVRPRSLPEFVALRDDAGAMPTPVRDFLRQDRLLVRVRAFAGQQPAQVEVRLVNLRGGLLLELPRLPSIGGAAQFELAFARFARGEYRLEIRAAGPAGSVAQLLPVRLIG